MTDEFGPVGDADNTVDVVIVGAGHGGAQAAIALRQQGFAGSILMIGREPELPYERPPLSKEYLARDKAFDRILIRPPRFWEEKRITLRLGCTVTTVLPAAHRITLSTGDSVRYGTMIWATGGDPRRMSCAGADLSGVYTIRTREDVDALMARLDAGATTAAIIGGGYIGLEAAAALRKIGVAVTLLEAQQRVLARVAGEALSDFYQKEHRAHGVDLRLGVAVDRIEGDGTRATGVRLADGTVVAADIVIVGIGIVPAVGPLIDAGATGDNGVLVDAYCRTSLPDIHAIGDCAAQENEFAGGATIRLESVQNASDQANTAARAIMGTPVPHRAVPWFWSNQYDLKLQTVGLSAGHDQAILRGDPATQSFTVAYLKAGRVVAFDCVNTVRDYVQGRWLVETGARIAPERLSNPDLALREMV